jgi:hypothetical protein
MKSLALRLPSRKLVLSTIVVSTCAAMMLAWSSPATLSVDGERVISDVSPVTRAHEAFIPLRAVSDSLGAQTTYDPKSGMVEVIRGDDTLRMRIGDKLATLNGNRMTLSHAPFELRGRTMVCLSVVARAFGSKVRFDMVRGEIDVISPGLVEAGAQQP